MTWAWGFLWSAAVPQVTKQFENGWLEAANLSSDSCVGSPHCLNTWHFILRMILTNLPDLQVRAGPGIVPGRAHCSAHRLVGSRHTLGRCRNP